MELTKEQVEQIVQALMEADADLMGIEQRGEWEVLLSWDDVKAAKRTRISLSKAHKILTGKELKP